MIELRVLTWNLFHGRDGFPGLGPTWRSTLLRRLGRSSDGQYVHVNRKLTPQMARLVARAAPQVAMLQEVPPGAISALSSETGMQAVSVRTGPFLGGVSLRARLGAWNPDLWRTHEGNANVILVGRGWRVVPGSVRSARLNPPKTIACAARRAALNRAEIIEWASESRRVVAAIIRGPGGERVLVACLHCTTNARVSHVEIGRARDLVVKWAGDLPIVLAGDFNVGPAHAGMQLLEAVGLREEVPDVGIDHIFVRGGTSLTARRWSASERDIAVRTGTQTARLRLSDHDPVEATIALDDVPSS